MVNHSFNQDRSHNEEPDDNERYEDEDPSDDRFIICPHCDRSIYDDSEQCPHCGEYLSREEAPHQRKPFWIILTAMVVLLLTILAIFQL